MLYHGENNGENGCKEHIDQSKSFVFCVNEKETCKIVRELNPRKTLGLGTVLAWAIKDWSRNTDTSGPLHC